MTGSDEQVILDTVLRPSPPLAPRTLLVILLIVGAINFAFALSFILRGAWPITPFLGADVALLAWAFRGSRLAARREERVTLTASLLRIVRREPRGECKEASFNPYWVRVDMEEPANHWSQLTLWSHGKGLRIGAFLPPLERASFAQTLRTALRAARSAR